MLELQTLNIFNRHRFRRPDTLDNSQICGGRLCWHKLRTVTRLLSGYGVYLVIYTCLMSSIFTHLIRIKVWHFFSFRVIKMPIIPTYLTYRMTSTFTFIFKFVGQKSLWCDQCYLLSTIRVTNLLYLFLFLDCLHYAKRATFLMCVNAQSFSWFYISMSLVSTFSTRVHSTALQQRRGEVICYTFYTIYFLCCLFNECV